MKKNLWVVLVTLGVLLLGCNRHPEETAEAVRAAESWLQTIDEGNYAESWDRSAAYFRNAMEKAEWEKTLEQVRSPLGELKERRVKSTRYSKSLPGAPDGPYVVIQFETTFGQKSSAVETVTPMWDEGQWKVSGYYIR